MLKAEVGYTGGLVEYPTYEQVCNGNTGHVEAVRVIYDPRIINYTKLIQYFFEIHDFSQVNCQGPDLGEQYLSKIFISSIIIKILVNPIAISGKKFFDRNAKLNYRRTISRLCEFVKFATS